MKLAKKVLSVVLALVLALSAFAVIGSANGSPDADYQAKIWLTASVGSATWTSNSKVKIDEGDESAPGATIEAQPGDTVFIRLYVTNNYYVHSFQTNLFYSADLIDAAEVYAAQRGKAITTANLKKIHIWNTAHYWVGRQGTSYSAQNAWSLQSPDAYYLDENWPTDDEGNWLFNKNEWKWNRINNLATEGVGETCIWDDPDNHIIMMPVTIPDDAPAGATYYVTVPEGLEQRSAKRYGMTRLYEIGIADGEDEPCDIVDAQAQLTPNMQYADDNQYFDYSEATITIQIPGASEPELDYTNIDAALDAASKVDRSNKTEASLAALDEAIDAATDARLNATEQEALEEAATALNAAIANLKVKANYDELAAQIGRYEAIENPSIYPAADWATATEKYNAAKAVDKNLTADDQATINAAATALKNALDALAALDYSALEAKYNELADKDVANYTDDTVARFNAALAAAKALVDNKNAASQGVIDAAYNELVAADAALALKAADYSALEAAKAKFTALNAKDWTSASYAAAKAKYDVANAIEPGLDITAQPTIDKAAADLEAAITALVPATGANYNALDAAIAEFEALVVENYTADSYAAAKTAYDAAKAVARDLTSEQQAQIDEAAADLEAALDDLVEADADYTKLNAAITAADAILNKKDGDVNSYSDATLEAINAAKATVVLGLKKKDQDKVDAMTAAINAAIASAEFRAWDYTAILAHIEAIEAKGADFYKAASYADYLAAKDALVWDYTYENFGLAKLQEINFLKVNPVAAAAADYSEVEAAQAAFDAKKAAANYTADSIAAVDAEIAKVNWDLNENHQAEVDAYAEAIYAAIEKMVEVVVEPADYSALDKAIEAAKALVADEYVNFADVAAALADAEAVARDLTADDQKIVDEAAAALNAAMDALEKKADYTALDAAILRAGTYDKNAWTADSWAVAEEKLAAAKAVARDLGVTAQPTIDEAADALNAALDALVAKEVVSSISTITWTPSEDTHNTFSVAVNGRPSMIQFIEMDGGTRTYDRYNKNVTIKSYNANGEEVNSLSREVAYEIWSIYTNLIGPDVKARAKYLEGTSYKWETEKYSFTVETLKPVFDADIRSIEPVATSGKKGAVATTVVVGPDAQGIRFVMDNGTTTTYYTAKATVLDNGDLQFVGNAWANHEGLNTIVVKVRVNNVWVEAGTVEYTVE